MKDTIARLRAKPLIEEAFALLRDKLSPALTYHSLHHSEDVFQEALSFALHDGLSGRTLELLAVAAAYHDLGFIDAERENETFGADYAANAMHRVGGYSEEERRMVFEAILDTRIQITPEGLRQIPSNILGQYLCDGDVSNLGRADFFVKAELIRQERGESDLKKFYQGLVTFLGATKWHTPAAQKLRSAGLEKNIEELRVKVAGL